MPKGQKAFFLKTRSPKVPLRLKKIRIFIPFSYIVDDKSSIKITPLAIIIMIPKLTVWPPTPIQGGGTLRKNKIIYYGLLRCLFRFITDITEFYYGHYGAFTREFVYSEKPNRARNPTFGEKIGQNGDLLLRILRNITDIT